MVKEELTKQIEPLLKRQACDKDELQNALKAFTQNGYKQITIMCWGEAAMAV